MAQFITVEQVDSLLGSDWALPDQKAMAIMQANDWLFANAVPPDTDDERITRAGAYLARMAARGELYASSKGNIKRKRVKGDTVESETEYMDGSRPVAGDMLYVRDLLSAWLSPYGSGVRLLRKL